MSIVILLYSTLIFATILVHTISDIRGSTPVQVDENYEPIILDDELMVHALLTSDALVN